MILLKGRTMAIKDPLIRKIFDDLDFDADLIKKRLEISAYLNSGLKIIFIDEVQDLENKNMKFMNLLKTFMKIKF